MQTDNLYDSPKAVSMRKELNELGEKMSNLQYQLFVVNNELQEKQKIYLEFLGVVKKDDEKEKGENNGS